jgi:hypothetical protein
MTVATNYDDRIALIKKIAEQKKHEDARKKRMAKVRSQSTKVMKQAKKVKRDFMQIPAEGENMYQWTDASKYAKEYYGETMYETTRFDNDWD